jgi:hypothetical protein
MKEERDLEYDSLDDSKILAAANVSIKADFTMLSLIFIQIWGVGVTIHELMHGGEPSWDNFGGPTVVKKDDPMWELWDAAVETSYSKSLVRLVKTCLMHRPQDRGNARDLLDTIEQGFDDDELATRMLSARHGGADGEQVEVESFQFPPRTTYALAMDPFLAQKKQRRMQQIRRRWRDCRSD